MQGTGSSIPPHSPLVSVREARRVLGGISAQTLYRLVRDGDLKIVKLRRRSFLRRADIDALIDRSTRKKAS